MNQPPQLYQKYFIDPGIERSNLFRNLKTKYGIEKVLYPGSFVHITPSFYFPEVVYNDQDKRCKKFFADKTTLEFIKDSKKYDQEPIIRFYEQEFQENLDEKDRYFDLLVSQYSGFISKYCTHYVKSGGYLLVNDSHGDATFAHHSPEYELIAIVNDEMEIEETQLEGYFTFSRPKAVDIEEVVHRMKGPKYKKSAYSYVFRRK